LEAFKRVLETDMFYPILVYVIAISLGSMYEFLCIFGYFMIGITFLLTIAHLKDNDKLRKAGKIANVFFTIAGFINIFANDLYFEDFTILT
jgi:hypothetical protein